MTDTSPQEEEKNNQASPPLLEEAWAEVKMLREQLEKSEKEKEEYLDLSKRIKADLVNYKKEQEKAMAMYGQYATTDILLTLFPIIDSFDLALKHLPEDLKSNAWAKGIMSIKQQLDSALKDMGVTAVATEGVVFSPEMHDAIDHEESEQAEGTITKEMQKGYILNGKLIRPAKVKIAKNK